jgi:hypothetical protein
MEGKTGHLSLLCLLPKRKMFYFLYRNGNPGNGEMCMKVYSVEQKSWKDVKPCILTGMMKSSTSSPYWNTPIIDRFGYLQLSFVWRGKSISEDYLINNSGIGYIWTIDGGLSWFDINNRLMDKPITLENYPQVFNVPRGSNLINQTGMAVDSRGYPHIVYYANDSNGIIHISICGLTERNGNRGPFLNNLMNFN